MVTETTVVTADEIEARKESQSEQVNENDSQQLSSDEDTSPLEEEAMRKGWKPIDEWEGDPNDHVSAKEFLDRESFFDRIKTQGNELKKTKKQMEELKSTIKELAEHHQKVREVEYNRAMEDLKARRKEAFESGDYDRLEEVEGKMDELKEIQESRQSSAQSQESNSTQEDLHPEVQEWVEENPWYNEDPIRRSILEGCLSQVIEENEELQGKPGMALEEATKLAKKEFPDRFGSTRRRANPVVEPGEGSVNNRGSGKAKYSARHLTAEQKEVGKRLVSAGALKNLDEYAQQLGDIGGLDN